MINWLLIHGTKPPRPGPRDKRKGSTANTVEGRIALDASTRSW